MSTKLKNLHVREVSLVGIGANQHAHVVLHKQRGYRGNDPTASQGGIMDDKLKKAVSDLEAAVGVPLDKMAEKFAELTKSAGAFTALLALTKAEREYAATLEGDALTKFMGEKADARLAIVKEHVEKIAKAQDVTDEVVMFGGQSISKKAVGEASFTIFKAQAAEIEKLQEDAAVEKAASEAETIFKNLPGEKVAKGKALRAIRKLSKDVADTIEAMLKGGSEAMAKQFKEIGKGGGGDGAGTEEKLNTMAKELATKESISFAKAYAKVLKTPEGSALYKQYDDERRSRSSAAA